MRHKLKKYVSITGCASGKCQVITYFYALNTLLVLCLVRNLMNKQVAFVLTMNSSLMLAVMYFCYFKLLKNVSCFRRAEADRAAYEEAMEVLRQREEDAIRRQQ